MKAKKAQAEDDPAVPRTAAMYNGAGGLRCCGCTCLVREDQQAFLMTLLGHFALEGGCCYRRIIDNTLTAAGFSVCFQADEVRLRIPKRALTALGWYQHGTSLWLPARMIAVRNALYAAAKKPTKKRPFRASLPEDRAQQRREASAFKKTWRKFVLWAAERPDEAATLATAVETVQALMGEHYSQADLLAYLGEASYKHAVRVLLSALPPEVLTALVPAQKGPRP